MFGSILSIDTFVFRFSPPLCHVMKTPDNAQRPPCLSHNSSSCSGVISNSIPSSFSLEYFKWFHKFFNYLYGLEDLVILRSAKTHCRQCSLCFSKSAFGKDFLHRSHILSAIIFSENSKRLSNTIFFAFNRIDGNTLLTALDRKGFALASGSACSSNNNEPSHVLMAMGVSEEIAQGALRISLGIKSKKTEVDTFLIALKSELDRLKQLTAIAA